MSNRAFLVSSETNYGLYNVVVVADTVEDMHNFCENSDVIWPGYYFVEIDLDRRGVWTEDDQ